MTVITEMDADVANKSPRAATDPNGPTGRFATWLANTTLDDAPSVDERANHSLLDGLACALVGAQLPVSRKGVEGINSVTRLMMSFERGATFPSVARPRWADPKPRYALLS